MQKQIRMENFYLLIIDHAGIGAAQIFSVCD